METKSTRPASVISIHIAPVAAVATTVVESVRAIPGKGLEGDRYFLGIGTFSLHPAGDNELTLIEIEALEALTREADIVIEPAEARRNIVTSGVALNHLIGRDFRIGSVHIRGIRLCEPCGHLEKLTRGGVKSGLVHRGGLRAKILTEGLIRAGDPVISL